MDLEEMTTQEGKYADDTDPIRDAISRHDEVITWKIP